MELFYAVIYVLIGVLLAVPYCLLAGWSADSFGMVVFVAPAFLFIWYVVASLAGVIVPGYGRVIHFNW